MNSFARLLAISFLITLTCTGWNCNAQTSSNSSPSVTSAVENPDPLGDVPDPSGSCGDTTITAAKTWHEEYNNGDLPGDVYIPWPGNARDGTNAQLGYYVVANMPATITNDVIAAINAWNQVLRQHAGGTVLITLTNTSDPYAPVRVFPDESANMALEPGFPGQAAIGAVPAPYDLLSFAQIEISSSLANNDTGAYLSALHEIGHTLGLGHSPTVASIMFPYLETSCFNRSPLPKYPNDTQYLEQTYDPQFVTPTGPVSCMKTCTCGAPQSVSKLSATPNTACYFSIPRSLRTTSTISRAQGSQSTYLNSEARAIRARRTLHFNLSHDSGEASATADELFLGSSLVAKIRVGPVVRSIDAGGYVLLVHAANVLRVIKGQATPSAIYVYDRVLHDGSIIDDDPPALQGETMVAFLMPSRLLNTSAPLSPLYSFAMPSISKYEVDGVGRIHSMSGVSFKAQASLENVHAESILPHFSGSTIPTTAADSSRAVSSAIARVSASRRVSAQSLRSYAAAVASDPFGVWRYYLGRYQLVH